MSWIAFGGASVAGKEKTREGRGGGGSDGYGDSGEGGGDIRWGSFHGVPLCGAAMCSGKGMPPHQLPKPGIDCVNRDHPCLPCDIVNLRLRTAVVGRRVKQAVAEAQKRYFCSVWNLLFGWIFPDHTPLECPNLRPGDRQPRCRSRQPRRSPQKQPWDLPYGADPAKMDKLPERDATSASPPERLALLPPPPMPGQKHGAPPKEARRGRGGDLRYNIWEMPMPDSSKGSKQAETPTPLLQQR